MGQYLGGQKLTCERGERVVFRGLDFTLSTGEVLELRGPNGAGKSSLLRLVAGFLHPAAGALLWDNGSRGTAPRPAPGALAYVGHDNAVKTVMTVAENLRLWALLAGCGTARLVPALERVGLAGLAAMPAQYLSAGQRRRLALARLLALPARLWLLDEPTSALDAGATATVHGLIDDHCAGGGMVMIASHEAAALKNARVLHLGGQS